MENLVTVIIAVIALVFVIWILVKLTKKIPPMSESQAIQHEIKKRVSKSPNPSSGFSFGKFIMFLIILAVIIGAIYLAFKGGFEFHP